MSESLKDRLHKAMPSTVKLSTAVFRQTWSEPPGESFPHLFEKAGRPVAPIIKKEPGAEPENSSISDFPFN